MELSKAEREVFGISIGSGIGGLSTIFEEANGYRGPRRTSPFFIPSLIINLAGGFVSIRYGLQGPNSAVATACATGTHAIGDAARQIMFGYADRMVAGGSDSVINPAGRGRLRRHARPVHPQRRAPARPAGPSTRAGTASSWAKGAGIVVLEEYELAKARGAKIYAEIAGYGMSGDAHHITSPSEDGDGPMRVMNAAIKDAGIAPEQVGYVNTHGTSTPAGDRIECAALKRVFGDHVKELKVSSTKSMTGHLLGAAGGLETIVCGHGRPDRQDPAHHQRGRPGPGLRPGRDRQRGRELRREYTLNNNFGFGGTNGCLVLRKI